MCEFDLSVFEPNCCNDDCTGPNPIYHELSPIGEITTCELIPVLDGITVPPEECDDNNSVFGDGCTNFLIDSGYSCDTINEPSVCIKIDICEDGLISENEECDDGNSNKGDGCENCSQTDKAKFSCYQKPDYDSIEEMPQILQDSEFDTVCEEYQLSEEMLQQTKIAGRTTATAATMTTATNLVQNGVQMKAGADLWLSFNFIQIARSTILLT